MKLFQKIWRVGRAFLEHTLFTLMALLSFKAVEVGYSAIYGDVHELVFGKVPVLYLFQTLDVVALAVLLVRTTSDMWNAFEGE